MNRFSSSFSALKPFALIAVPFVTFILGWHTALNNPRLMPVPLQTEGQNKTSSAAVITTPKNQANINKFNLEIVDEVYQLIESNYVDKNILKEPDVEYGLARGLVSALDDPYSVFMTPKENRDFQDSLEGKLEGIGAELTLREGLLTVVSPLKNSPAARAGLMPEDIILKINQESTEGMTLEQAVMKIRGPKDTEVTLQVINKNEDERELKIQREEINVDSVTWEMKDNQIALISLNQFGDNTTKEFNAAVNEILLKDPKGVILDLRFNGGGYLDGAVDIVSCFLAEGDVVKIKKRTELGMETLAVNGNVKIANLPLVVLINKGSASASEIVAGALEDHKRALILGEQSFGKGTVQEVIPLSDGSSLRLTIAKWFTPNGNDISKKGITPDQEVKRTLEDFTANRDPQLDSALEYLKKEAKK